MNCIKFHIENWAAWAPKLENKAAWQAWCAGTLNIEDTEDKPSLDFLPPMFRRRLSQLSKSCIQVAFDCLAGQKDVISVFASRHGEMQQLVKLITAIAGNETVSPASFSMSVHNTAAGLFSIANKNTAPSNTIAAGEHAVEAAFIEAAGILQSAKSKKVLLIIADESINEAYHNLLKEPQPPYALAFLLTNDSAAPAFKMSFTKARSKNIPESSGHYGLQFMRWFLGEKKNALVLPGIRVDTQWELCPG